METSKKLFTKIITNWLYSSINQYKLISKSNYADLQGGQTTFPIKILKNLLEDAKEKRKKSGYFFKTSKSF